MTKIDKSKPVLVTGANGYIASWIVKRLLEEGISVNAAVRDPSNENKVGHLKNLNCKNDAQLRFFKADLMDNNSYKEAMEGCELVYHTASPYTLNVKDPIKDLIDPAVKGTENVLNTANETSSVKRVVITSSCAALHTDAVDTQNSKGGSITEEDWNTTASEKYQPYYYSKTLAEQKAWEMLKNQSQWDLVTINPSGVFGPPLNKKDTGSESVNMLIMLGNGEMKMGVPKIGIGLVDVRDVAEAHIKAGFTEDASGRYITSAHNTNFLEMSKALLPKYGDKFPLPKQAVPKWLLLLIGPLANKMFTKKFVKNNVNQEWRADNSKIKKELGITFRPLKETMEDSFETLINSGILKAKK